MSADKPVSIATMYRNHAALVDKGERYPASNALLIEFNEVGQASLLTFDRENLGAREAIQRLLNAALILNSEAAH